MTQRRMISLEVINTDAFLDMPQSSQLLYFHLNARADDDGFVANPKSVMRVIGSQDDDLKLLAAKKFLITFDDGVCVIKHWRINNYIRKDIYKETKYLNHKQVLFIRPNGAYTLTDDGRAVSVPNGHFQLEDVKPENASTKPFINVHVTSTASALRIGKDRIGKDSIIAVSKPAKLTTFSQKGAEILKAFEEVDPKNKTYYANKTQRAACDFLIQEYTFETVLQVINLLPKINQQNLYIRQITTPHELKENWVKIKNALLKLKNGNKKFNDPNYVL